MPLILMTLSASGAAARGGDGGGARFIVVFHEGIDAEEASLDLAVKHGVSADHLYQHGLSGFAGPLGVKAAQEIARDPRVKSVEPDGVMSANAQTVPTGIRRIGGLASPTAKIDGVDQRVNVDIAIIDTGVSTSNTTELLVFKNIGYKLGRVTGGNDDNGHGSHCAGTAAAIDNGSGVVGVAPGARIWAVKVLGKNGTGWTSDIIKGVDYVTSNKASIEVANMSLGGGPSLSLDAAVRTSIAAGVTYALAAGNENDDAVNHSPARVAEAITVAALADSDGLTGGLGGPTSYGADDTFATFSNYGSLVDLIAPGVSIYSTVKGTGYATYSGTSMAAPHVAGAAALYKAGNPAATPGAVRDALRASSAESIPGTHADGSYPLLNVAGY